MNKKKRKQKRLATKQIKSQPQGLLQFVPGTFGRTHSDYVISTVDENLTSLKHKVENLSKEIGKLKTGE